MIIIKHNPLKKKQGGIALLVLVITIALALSAYYLSNISIVKIQSDNLQQTGVALKKAKQILIAHAVTRSDLSDPSIQTGRYGYLPCPANNNGEGNSVGTCEDKHDNALGWFPWRTLEVLPLKDGNGDCLLYAVSGAYKSSPEADMLNEDSSGMFQIIDDMGFTLQGNSAPDRIVAVIFSAGDSLPAQNRVFNDGSECGDDIDNFAAYLDSLEVAPGDIVDNSAVATSNADEIYRIVQAAKATNESVINDYLITISREEIWSAIIARNDFNQKMSNLTEALAVCLRDYALANTKNRLPWPAPMNLADYRVDNNYDDNPDAGLGHAGRFPYIVLDSNDDIDIAAADNQLFVEAVCDNLVLTSGGITVDLVAPALSDEYINFWKNWKDHFFYVVSQGYAPATAVVDTAATCPGGCISVNGIPRAATVIFSGPSDGQIRTGPVVAGDADNKNLIANYIENGSELVFPDLAGNGVYPTGGNEIMFCIEPDLVGVVPC